MQVALFGAANPETARVVAAVRRVDPSFEVVGLLDNDVAKHGTELAGLPVLGGVAEVERLAARGVRFVNLITGSVQARFEVTRDVVQRGGLLTNLIHPSVDLMLTTLGMGCYLQEAVVLQAGVVLGDNVSIHTGSIVGHESQIGPSTFVAHAVSISGKVGIGGGCFIGTNATILPRIRVGRWATIGAGAVVTRDVPDFAVVVGNPARVLRIGPTMDGDGRVFPAPRR